MTEPTPDANWPSVWTVSAARMSSFSAYREAAAPIAVDSSRVASPITSMRSQSDNPSNMRSSMAARSDKSHAPIPDQRLQGMNTRHAVIESPLGELTLVAEDDALTGLYFRHHWYRPADDTIGPRVDAESDALLAEAQAQLTDYLAGRRHRLRSADHTARQRSTAACLAATDHHPLRRDLDVWRTGRGACRRHHGPGGRAGGRPQPAEHHRPVPSSGR